jgi:transcriptional regulator with XRE-family HTH domain
MSFVQKQLTGGAEFGHDLRELRELRGLSLDELSRITKIHSSVISALEEERFQDLADPVYAERLVRALVATLEGRPAYFIKKYRERLEDAGLATEPQTPRPSPKPLDFFVLSRAVAFIGFLLLVGLAAAYVFWQGRALQDAPSLVVSTPVDGAIVDRPDIDVQGTTDPTATVLINGRPAVVDRDGHFSASFDIPRGATTLVIEARRRFGSSATVVRRVTYERPDSTTTTTQ